MFLLESCDFSHVRFSIENIILWRKKIMIEYLNFNKEYSKNLTPRFLKELADNIRPILQEEDLFLLNLDIIGIQVNRIVYNSSANDFYFYLDFIEQKFGIC